MHDIVKLTGDDLRRFLDELVEDVENPTDVIRHIRITIDEGTVKLKVNEGAWTEPLGALETPAARPTAAIPPPLGSTPPPRGWDRV